MMEEAFPTIAGLRNYESIFSPLHDKDGNVTAVVVTNRDITERKQTEEALRENQKLLTSIYDTALVGIAVVDAQGCYVQVNRAFCEIYGYSAAEVIGKHFHDDYCVLKRAKTRRQSHDARDSRGKQKPHHRLECQAQGRRS